MWKKSKHITNANNFPFSMNSIFNYPWPPRCYRCSFCGRDFRSAQALGGHMNVHRRDRAKLQQSSSPPPPKQSQVGKNKNSHHQKLTSNSGNVFPKKIGGLTSASAFMNYEDILRLEDGETLICKRHKKSDRTMEDIDLELRLGDPPGVKYVKV
ncbi:hypothetical protein BUALT_BualtUnG0019400 [Buddleja alternifolia]|uniref:C2H2-type domain-containing protein n=1 Tax=Buddleja alternifolia TaxID=168488 RepID=A0AAV6W118_9LAMI|nr:hypothetical protein BUALT_BualtUnG0019400 [Buddleja alternifolia]